ncbi:MAG: hypothetical protein QXT26_07075 [Thermoproteota archaeon]
MKMFIVKAEDLPKKYRSGGGDVVKCGGCNWEVSKLYVLANSKKEAVKLVKNGEAGLCGDCMCEMIAEEEWEI